MTNDLETLLRDTFDGRARTVSHAPGWQGGATRRNGPWLAVAAVAACATGAAVAASALLAPGSPTPAAGVGRATCSAALPAAWQHAINGGVLTYRGRAVVAGAAARDGTVIGLVRDDSQQVVAVLPNERVRPVTAVPVGSLVTQLDTDGRYVVVNSTSDRPGAAPDSVVDRITVIDLHLSRRIEVLNRQHGFVLGRGAVLQDDTVYWLSGSSKNATSGSVHAYDLRSRRYSVVGTARTPEIDRDVRGVGWVGGSVPAAHVPDGLPAFFDRAGRYRPVYAGGATLAWQDRELSPTVRVMNADGTVAQWHIGAGSERVPHLDGVAGDFVFFELTGGSGESALDTRTGAVTYLGNDVHPEFGTTSSGSTVVFATGPAYRSHSVDLAALPELRC